MRLQEKELPPGHINTLVTLDRLALVYREEGKFKDAEPLYQRAIGILERKTPEENLDLAYMAEQRAIMLRRMNREKEAAAWEGRAANPRQCRREDRQVQGRRRSQGVPGIQVGSHRIALGALLGSAGFRTTGDAAASLTTSWNTSGRA